MNKQTKIGFILGTVAIMALLVWLFSSGGEEKDQSTALREPFVSSNWTKRFQLKDKNPYGLYLFNELTRAHLDGQHVIRTIEDWDAFDTLVNEQKSRKTYLFVGNNFGLEDEEIDTIMVRLNEGSDFLISFNDMTDNLYDRLLEGVYFEFDYSEGVNVFTDSNKYEMIHLFQNDTIAIDWKAFSVDDTLRCRTLSSFMEMSNFLRIPVGKGNLYLHANPNMFCNFQVQRPDGFRYSEYVLSALPENRDIYILELGRLSDNYGNFDVDEQEGAGEKRDDSYFQLIFRTPQFLTALLLSIGGLLLFVIFRARRTRPVVPYVPKKKDMTMAFAETITSIYFSKRNPYGLLQVQRKNFYATVQKHFFVDLNRRDGDKSVLVLAEKSNRRFEEIKSLLDGLETKEAFSVTEPYVAEMQKRIHEFYRSTGVISDEMRKRVEHRDMVFRRSIWLPVLLINAGIFAIILGTYYLVGSIGVGITLWPVGILLLFQGIVRIVNPYMKITRDEMTYYQLPLGKRTYKREDLQSVELRRRGVIFHFANSKHQIINYWDMSSFDRKQFKQWLSKLNTLKL